MQPLKALPPLSLYVHMPWCVRKCPYCDFNSHEAGSNLDEPAYLEALTRDLESSLPGIWGRRIESVFIGGGTPSLMSPETIKRLISTIRALLPVAPLTEITMEANPGTVDVERFTGFVDAGVNRLSIGIQSFSDEKLQALGRIHDRAAALKAFKAARNAGFENINLDLMFGLPNQTEQEAIDDLQTAIDLYPEHISLYQLTIEPNTLFHHQPPELPSDDAIWSMQQVLQSLLVDAGYKQYEVSAYAREGKQCRHNLNYWQFGDYLGIGAGAHGKISMPERIVRTSKRRHPREYMETAGQAECDSRRELAPDDRSLEFMMNALRLTEGFQLAMFQERTGLAFSQIVPALETAEAKGLIERDAIHLRPTESGQRYLNDLLQMFLP
ncbi:MAG: radical SAM family heme chaperone HemW [Acidiferrobacterales bacterium]